MYLPRIEFRHDIRPKSIFLVGPTFGIILATILLLPLSLLLPQPDLTALAQEPDPWCGDGTCNEDYGEAYYNCRDCLNSCDWCTDQAFCDAIMPDAEWWFVPQFSGCSTEGCCVHVPPPDSEPPVTSAILEGIVGLDGWFLSPVTVTLSVTDNMSGVFSTALDGINYDGPRVYSAEGPTTIAYQSYDVAGNLEPLKSSSFWIDTVDPSTYIASPADNSWVSGVVTIAGISVDETSGLAGVDVSFDGGLTWRPTTGGEVWSYQWDTRTLGVNVIQVRGRDVAGNAETPITFAVSVDNSNPFFDVGPFPGEYNFVASGPLTFTLTAFDEQSGIANSAIVVKQNGKDIRVLQAPAGELRGAPVVWDGRDAQGNLVPVGDYQLLFYTANRAGGFGSFGANFKVVDTLPAGGVIPMAAPLSPASSPPDDAPWILTPNPPQPTIPPSMAAIIERMFGGQPQGSQPQISQSNNGDAALVALSKLTGASAGSTSSRSGAVGTGIGGLLVLAAAYIAGQQATGNLNLGKKLAALSTLWTPSAKPEAPPVPANLAPPLKPPPPPPSPPRPRMLRWDEMPQSAPEPEPEPVIWYPPPKPKPPASSSYDYYANPWPSTNKPPTPSYTYYANPWPAKPPKPSTPSYTYYANPWPTPPKPPTPSYTYYANPWPTPPKPPTSSYDYYANPWSAVPLDVQALKRNQERERLHESLDNSNLNWFQKKAAELLGETALALDEFDQYIGTPMRETAKTAADAVKKISDDAKEREQQRAELRAELNKTDLPAWQKALAYTLADVKTDLDNFDQAIGQYVRPGLTKTIDQVAAVGKGVYDYADNRSQEHLRLEREMADMPAWKRELAINLIEAQTSLSDFDQAIGQHVRPGLTKAVESTGDDLQKLAGLKPLAPGETLEDVKFQAVVVDSLDLLTLGFFQTEAGKQMAVGVLTGAKDAVDHTSHNGRMAFGLEELDPGVNRLDAFGETLYGASTIMSLGGTADIREGIEEGDPVKVILGTLQTVTMFAGIGAAGSSLRAIGGKALGMVDDIAYKEILAVAKTAMTTGETIDAISGGVQAIGGVATGNPIEVIAGLANIGMADLPTGVTKELTEEAAEKLIREAAEEGIEATTKVVTRETAEEVAEVAAKETVDTVSVVVAKDAAKEADEIAERSLRSFEQLQVGYEEEGMEYVVRNFEDPSIHRDLINPHPDANGHCTSVAISTNSILGGGENWTMSIDYGRVTSGLDQRQLLDFNLAYLEAGGVGHRSLDGDELFEEMLKRGDGSRALLFIKGTDDVAGHVVNVVNVNGKITFLDGQAGKTFDTLDGLLDGRPFDDLILTDPMNDFVAPGQLPTLTGLSDNISASDLVMGSSGQLGPDYLRPTEGELEEYYVLIKRGQGYDDITPHHLPANSYMSELKETLSQSANKDLALNLAREEAQLAAIRQATENGIDLTGEELEQIANQAAEIMGENIDNFVSNYKVGLKNNVGTCINMDQPYPGVGGRHRATATYGGSEEAYYQLTPRDALAQDIWDVHEIYRADGLYKTEFYDRFLESETTIQEQLARSVSVNEEKWPGFFEGENKELWIKFFDSLYASN